MNTPEPTLAAFPNPLIRYFAATRPAFLSATLVACFLGLASAVYAGTRLNLPLALTTLLLALLVHAAVNVLNDYYDALNGCDACNTERLFPFTGGSRFIQNGVLTVEQTAQLGYGLLFAALLGGGWLVWLTAPGLLWIGAMGLFVGWAYSAAPFKLNSRGLGEACVWLGFVGVVAGADFVQRQGFAWQPWLLGAPLGLLTTNLLYINQFPDRKADAAVGKRHWVVRLSAKSAGLIYPVLVIMAVLMLCALVLLGMLPRLALLSLLPCLLSWRAARILRQNVNHPAGLRPAIQLTIAAMLLHGLLLAGILYWETH